MTKPRIATLLAALLCFFTGVFNAGAAQLEDFESLTPGQPLSQQGWTVLYGGSDWEVFNGTSGSVAVGKTGLGGDSQVIRNTTFTSPITDSVPGQAYFSAVITPKIAGSSVQWVRVGAKGINSNLSPTIGFAPSIADTSLPVLAVQPSNNAASIRSSYPLIINHAYEVRLQITIPSDFTLSTGTLYYRDLTAGEKIWHTSPDLRGIDLQLTNNTKFSILNTLWLRSAFRADIDDIKMGMGVPDDVLLEDFEALATGQPLSQQGWTVLYGGSEWEVFNGTSGSISVGKTGLGGDSQVVRDASFISPITDSVPGQAYFSAVITPKMAGSSAQASLVGAKGINSSLGPAFGFAPDPEDSTKSVLRLKTTSTSPDILGTETMTINDAYEVRLQVNIPQDYTKSTGTLFYRNITEGETNWRVCPGIENVDLELTANTRFSVLDTIWMRCAFRAEIDDIKMGMGCVESLAPTDYVQNELDAGLSPVYTPITHTSYFNFEYELFGYNPRFDPNVVTFDSFNRPYIMTGYRSGNDAMTEGKYIQTLDSQGRWIILDPTPYILAEYPQWDKVWGSWDEHVIFDDDDDAYILLRANSKNLLLYSRDYCRSWQVYELPMNITWNYCGIFESRTSFNDCSNPPAIINGTFWIGGNLELVFPQKNQDGTLTIPSPVVVYNATKAWLTPNHSGLSNVMITKNNLTHIVWMTKDDLAGHTGEGPCYAATYNHTTGQVSSPVLIGFSDAQDEHNPPVIEIDSNGYLHVIIGAHHQRFQYTKSLMPNSTQNGWTTPVQIGSDPGGYTYTALVCDSNDKLHLVSRNSTGDYNFRLSYMYKPAGQSWVYDTTLVAPGRPYYVCWYHQLHLDRQGRLFINYVSYVNQLDRGALTGEVAAYMAKWPEENIQLTDPASDWYSVTFHTPVLLISDDSGASWRIAETSDFIPSP